MTATTRCGLQVTLLADRVPVDNTEEGAEAIASEAAGPLLSWVPS
jgi:hypothetical protein